MAIFIQPSARAAWFRRVLSNSEIRIPKDLDPLHAELTAKGVPFYGPPENYVWNARCAYFTDPDDTLWELYAWLDGGPGDYHDEQP